MASKEVKKIQLKDYTLPPYLFKKTDLVFDLIAEDNVVVSSKIAANRNPDSKVNSNTIKLDGAPASVPQGSKAPTMELLEVKINGKTLSPSEYNRSDDGLTIFNLPTEEFNLEVKTRINPKANRALKGLYTSGGIFTTQCEAEAFRNITFYQDRPDVLSTFTTTIIAEKGKYSQLLSNGNPGELEVTSDGRDKITWEDPHPKPCYLFALVAGNLAAKRDVFTTKSGRKVDLVIYADKSDISKVDHAMVSLKRSMEWDEKRFGREYDLDLFQVVAVNDFNTGAMENKGLNIFNASAILADPKTATDAKYLYVEAVIAHEYFHNWSGDRVTLRDWFQLSLKEGFTVFREQEFTADYNSRAVKRIEDVDDMRSIQFPEDAGAMAHPIRPASVGSIDNFFTMTIYDKGSEVIRMMHTMLGEEAFRKGTDIYFERHDGQAVTTEDFVQAMRDGAKAAGKPIDLNQFEKTWYNQAGTPTLDVTDEYDAVAKVYKITISQSTPATPNQDKKEPFHIPIRIGLLGKDGKDLPLNIDKSQADLLTNGDILNLKDAKTTFIFCDVPEKPLPSLLRDWSAPVKLNYNYSLQDLSFLMAHDSDGFNRWDSAQQLAIKVLKSMIADYKNGTEMKVDQSLINAFKAVLLDESLDKSLAAKTLKLPSIGYITGLYPDGEVDIDAITSARKKVRQVIGKSLEPELAKRFKDNRTTEQRPYQWTGADVGERAIKNISLSYLTAGNPEKYLPSAIRQLDLGHNILDVRCASEQVLEYADEKTRNAKMEELYQACRDNQLAVNQWFADQAGANRPDVLNSVKSLMKHEAYNHENADCIRMLIGSFAANSAAFHKKDGSGYEFVASQIIDVDKFNPEAAARLTKSFATANKYDPERIELIHAQLDRILAEATSSNVKEIASNSLKMLAKSNNIAGTPTGKDITGEVAAAITTQIKI